MEDEALNPADFELVAGSPEYDAAMAAKFDEQTPAPPSDEPPAEQRPGWLPEKFQSPEDLAKAYEELEKKLSAPKAPEAALEVKPEGETQEDEVKTAVQNAGLDFDDLTEQFRATGDITAESREALVKAGYDDHLIDTHIAGLKAIQQLNTMTVYSEAGGEEAYTAMTAWAGQNLSDVEINAFNETLDSNDMGKVKLAVAGLKAKYEATNGAEPNLFTGQTGQTTGDVFRSTAELTAAMKDPRYKTDPAYRSDVEKKLGRSNIM